MAAASEVRKVTDRFIIASNGVYGTTCVRSGCMPSKVLIQAAAEFHEGRKSRASDSKAVLTRVRAMRDDFLKYSLESTERYRPFIIEGRAHFHTPGEIEVQGKRYEVSAAVLATGSSPIVPDGCAKLNAPIITSDTLFDLEELPSELAMLGLNVLGAEMGQALSRLGCRITAHHDASMVGGLSDPEISRLALEILREEMEIVIHEEFCDATWENLNHHPVFVAQSRKANLEKMGLEPMNICKPGEPVTDYDPHTMQVRDLPLFVAGDVKLGRSILHEARDEGRIAGYNAARKSPARFKRRTPLQITHTDPAIAVVGTAWNELAAGQYVIGRADYKNQGRARIMGMNKGMLHVYAHARTGRLLGAEMMAPEGEHLAHLVAWLIDRQTTVSQALHLPFYHPTVEEGLRSALEDAADQMGLDSLSSQGLSFMDSDDAQRTGDRESPSSHQIRKSCAK